MTPLIAYNGTRANSLTLDVSDGLWIAELMIDQPVAMPEARGESVVTLAGSTLTGQLDPSNSGVFVLTSRVRVCGGFGWRSTIKAQEYRNDIGVKAAAVVRAAAAACGEVVLIAPSSDYRLNGNHYVRPAGTASRSLSALFPGWFVGFDGTTYVARPEAKTHAIELLSYDPSSEIAEANFEALTVGVGDTITSPRLPAPRVVRAFTVVAQPAKARVHFWTGAA
jgi:hypothetical protein